MHPILAAIDPTEKPDDPLSYTLSRDVTPLHDLRLCALTNQGEKRRNRKWPNSRKAAIVAEILEPGASVNAVAARHGAQANQLSRRQMARNGKLVLPAPEEAMEFVPLMVASAAPAEDPGTGPVEIVVGAATVRREPSASPERIAAVVRALA